MFKDQTPNVKLIQGEDENGQPTTMGVVIDAKSITPPKRESNDENEGDSIIYTLEAGELVFCPKCKKYKPRKAYSRHKTRKNGLQGRCISCMKEEAIGRRRAKLEAAENENE